MTSHRHQGFPLAMLFLLGSLLAGCAHSETKPPAPARPNPLIAVSVSTDGVYLVDPSTGNRRELVGSLSGFRSGYAAWSPDRDRIAYAHDGIVVLEPQTNESATFVRGDRLSMPAWDPGGTHLAYSDGIALWVTSLGHVAPHRVHVPAILAPVDLAWSRNGVIAFEGVTLDCSQAVRCVTTGSSEIWTIRSDGTALVRMTDVGHAEGPKWTPDGSRLLFIRRYPSTGRQSEVWTADATGGQSRRLVAERDIVAADWSPDGSRLAVITQGSQSDTLQLWVGGADGTGLRRVGTPFSGSTASIDW
jgi:Tol biopolymer transport system component